jgi:quercetin dioxygenase-like cupin family protein
VDAIVLRRPEGEEVAMQDRRSVLIKVDLEQIGMTETWFGSRQHGAPRHIHRRHADSFYVLDGELTFLTACESLHADPSALCIAPPGVVNGFDHDADDDVRYINFHAPGRGFIESLRARRRDPATYDQGTARVVNVHAPSCGFHEYLHVMDDADGELAEATHTRYDVFEVE